MLILPLSIPWLVGLAQGAEVIGSSATYSNLASVALFKRAHEVSEALTQAGFLPRESFSNADLVLVGQATHPSARIFAGCCEYEFRGGALQCIRRRDLFEDKGPASLILPHLTNEVLTLTLEAATNRAWDVLRLLSYPVQAMQRVYRVTVGDDLMDAYPIRNGGPNFPRDLHFYGELISRRKIKISVGLIPGKPSAPGERDGPALPSRISFLATTGELLEAMFLPDQAQLMRLGVSSPEPIVLGGAVDFTAPVFVSATRKLASTDPITPKAEVRSLIHDAWKQLHQELGTNQPKCVLVCENLNDPGWVASELTELAGTTPWAGVSHLFRFDLPFERTRMDALASTARGIRLLAICGRVEIRVQALEHPEPMEPPSSGELSGSDGQQRWKLLYEVEQRRMAPLIDGLIERLGFSETVPDHAVFLLQPTIPFPHGSILENELPRQLNGKAQVISVMGESDHWFVGGGVTYFNGKVLTNTTAVVALSGFLPLQEDTMRLMAIHRAGSTNAPDFDPENLRQMKAQPPRRILSAETIAPVRELAYAFGPNPLEEIVAFFGQDGVQVFQNADFLEVFEIQTAPATGPGSVEGYRLVAQGTTLGREAAHHFGAAMLSGNSNFRAAVGCDWRPIVVFRVRSGGDLASLIVCFECNLAVFRLYDATGKQTRSTHPFLCFERDVLLRLARQALPNSAILKKIER